MPRGENGTPETPEWHVEPRGWDADRCCPTSCMGVCESPSNAVLLHGTDGALERLMTRAKCPLPEATWSQPGDLGAMSIESMSRGDDDHIIRGCE